MCSPSSLDVQPVQNRRHGADRPARITRVVKVDVARGAALKVQSERSVMEAPLGGKILEAALRRAGVRQNGAYKAVSYTHLVQPSASDD